MMMEKSRIARRPEGEPTFHVFYQLLAGIEGQTRRDLHLENLNEPNLFMTPLQRVSGYALMSFLPHVFVLVRPQNYHCYFLSVISTVVYSD